MININILNVTTIVQPIDLIAQRAIEITMDLIAGRSVEKTLNVLDVSLKNGETTN